MNPRPALSLSFAFATLLAATTAPAQGKPKGAPPEPMPTEAVPTERTYTGSYSESLSRDLFRSCDADGDDRLDVFEVRTAFDAVRSVGDDRGLHELDVDRDGYVGWSEFDGAFRRGIEHGGTFRIRTSRRFLAPTPPPRPATALQKFLHLHDTDGDGSLSVAELARVLPKLGLPPLAVLSIGTIDRDGSGAIDETELAPLFEHLPPKALQAATAAAESMPPPWRAADSDGNGVIDAAELQRMLQRLDPMLGRWSNRLLTGLDKNKSGALEPAELPRPTMPPAPPTRTGTPPAGAPER
jgi:Ca2+-binding EF-hand superfamily protein